MGISMRKMIPGLLVAITCLQMAREGWGLLNPSPIHDGPSLVHDL